MPRLRRPADDGRREDLQPAILKYAADLGWVVHRPDCVFVSACFSKPGKAAVWSCRRGWAFAQLVQDPDWGWERCVNHRYYYSMMEALEDNGPGPGRFNIRTYPEGKPVTPRPVTRANLLLALLHAYGCQPDWRVEMTVGAELICGRTTPGQPGEGHIVTQYTVTRVS